MTTNTIVPGYNIGSLGVNPRGANVIYREDLQYVGGGSDKVYIGIVSQTGAKFYADCFYGRRSASLNAAPQGEWLNEASARSQLAGQLNGKKQKGYKPTGAGNVNQAVAVPNRDKWAPRVVWPMGAIALPEKKRQEVIDSNEWIAEEKEDGCRLTVHILENGIEFHGRNAGKQDTTRPLEYTKSLSNQARLTLPDKYVGTIIDVEALAPGMDAAQVSGMLQATDGRDTSMIYFKAFDLIQDGLVDMTSFEWKLRRTALTRLFKEMALIFGNSVFGKGPGQPIVSATDMLNDGLFRLSRYTIVDKEQFHNDIIAVGGEGTMWKHINSKYKEGAKPAGHWYKWKKHDTSDVVIMGYTKGQGKYYQQVGAVIYGQYMTASQAQLLKLQVDSSNQYYIDPNGALYYLVEIGQCSGMTDPIRLEFTNNPGRYPGCVMEVEFMERTKTGALRHPRYVRLRDDKDAHDCIYTSTETTGKVVEAEEEEV